MSMIRVEKLTFSYPGSYDEVFRDVSFTIDTDWKLGFVGRNGRGKTTFLKLLMGKYEYQGHITSSAEFDYFPYQVTDKERFTEEIIKEVCPDAENWEIVRELSYLDVSDEVLWRPFNTLSNGEQTKALLSALFLNEGHFLLIDEPTNHLDSLARDSVARYLNRKKGFILVSHDRSFLDSCIDHILSINRQDIEVRSGNFSDWFMDFEKRQETEAASDRRLRADIERLKSSARRTADWSDRVEASKAGAADKGYVGHKAAKMMKRSKTIERRRERAIEERSGLLKNAETKEELKLCPLSYKSSRLLSFDKVSLSYDGKRGPICSPVTFTVDEGERIFLEGRNGCGKSSILKLILSINGENAPLKPSTEKWPDQIKGLPSGLQNHDTSEGPLCFPRHNFAPDHTGNIRLGSGLIISYVPQDSSFLTGDLSGLAKSSGIDESLFKTILRKMGFERIMFEKDMAELSEGQKKKVLLAKSLCERAHLYIWDEPLNYIDIYSRIQIEELILRFQPTILLVEHDRTFRERVGTKTVALSPL